MIFYKDGKLIDDIKGLMAEKHAEALGFPTGRLTSLTRPQAAGLGLPTGWSSIAEYLGRAVVRQKIDDTTGGAVAFCFVTLGTIKWNDRVRVIRQGVVVFPPAEQTIRIRLISRSSQDIAKVHEGYECGIKIAAYDDIKVGDVIEAFRLEGDAGN